MSKINVRSFSNENEDGAPDLVGISTLSATSYFIPTRGTTAQRPSEHVEEGSLRYNYDTKTLEYYRGHTIGWDSFELIDPDLGGRKESAYSTTSSNDGGLGTRLLLAGGRESAPAFTDKIEFVTISSLGNAQDFGNLTQSHGNGSSQGGAASRTRGIWLSGQLGTSPSYSNVIQFVTFASQGDAQDFGDINSARAAVGNLSNETRAVCFGGSLSDGSKPTQIDAVTIAASGQAFDFGDMSTYVGNTANLASSTRGIMAGGSISPSRTNTIQFITINTSGNTVDFGDLSVVGPAGGATTASYNGVGYSNSTRGIIHGGRDVNNNHINSIQFITIATTGNSSDFGDTAVAAAHQMGGSSPTRGVVGAGFNPSATNAMEFVNIMSLGNASDFGDCTARDENLGACSNGHGGL